MDTPSQLARALVNDLCKTQLRGCQCCPAIVAALWKRQLSSTVRAGIAHCQFNADTFNSVVQLADDIHATSRPIGSVAAIASMDETLPALQSSVVPEVAATSRGGRGRGRGGRGRGGRGGNRGGQSNSSSNQNNQARPRSGTKHPDLPDGDWSGCNMHFRWGKGAFFCSEPSTCPWKNVYASKPAKQ